MKTRLNISSILAFSVLLFLAASCATPKKVLYLRDMENDSQIELENKIQAVIVPYDELDIIISCPDPEIAKPFNIRSSLTSGAMGNTGGNNQSFTYLVDPYGNIQLPVLGEVRVAGLTRLQLQDKITKILEDGAYLADPYVMVRFYNFKVFFLGADGGKAINIPNERCTFLEALAMAGDISPYTRRDKIGILREQDGVMTMHYMDPRSSEIFNDPYFTLQKNDIIITRSNGAKYWRDEISFWSSWVSITTSLASLSTTVLLILNLVKPAAN